jgi:hypothetical protein
MVPATVSAGWRVYRWELDDPFGGPPAAQQHLLGMSENLGTVLV